MAFRTILCLTLLAAACAQASPYGIHELETFEDPVLDDGWTCALYVGTAPADPDQSYALLAAPAGDGSQGLLCADPAGTERPELRLTTWCNTCGDGSIAFDLLPVAGAGETLVSVMAWNESMVPMLLGSVVAAGQHSFAVPDGTSLMMISILASGAILDNVEYTDWCDCFSADEAHGWGEIKAFYGD